MSSSSSIAKAGNNPISGPRATAVQDLVVEGPGTLRPAKPQSSGGGKRGDAGWSVVLVRPLPQGLAPGARTQVAFAVWEGANQEAGARKMRTAWVPLAVEGAR